MLEGEDYCKEALCATDASFHRQRPSLNATEVDSAYPGKLHKQDSQPTLPELPAFSSRALDFEEATGWALEAQMGELMHRFAGIHGVLIGHAERESQLHERRRGFKTLTVDPAQLLPDYSNKANIIGDIVTLVEAMEGGWDRDQEMLETKFLEYYLERHYGGLANECNNLSIQERLDEDQGEEPQGEGDE
jgi:hypothetical protein